MNRFNDFTDPDTEDGRVRSVLDNVGETKVEAQCKKCQRKAFKNPRFMEYDRDKGKYVCQYCEDSDSLVWICTGIPLNAHGRQELDSLRNEYHLGFAVRNDGTEFPCGKQYEESQQTRTVCEKCQNPMYFG